MGAMARQVPQVKRKNSMNWIWPDARLTVDGSVASRLGPREVATGYGVGARVSVGKAGIVSVGRTERGSVGGTCVEVVSIRAVGRGSGVAVAAAGAQEARKTASKPRRRRRCIERIETMRGFISIRAFITKNPYEKITLNINLLLFRCFDGSKILRYTRLVDSSRGHFVFSRS